MEILINNAQNDVSLELSLLKKTAQQALELEKVDPSAELSVSFVSKDRIWKLNRQYRLTDSPTDVLAFSFTEQDDQGPGQKTGMPVVLGDVVISPEVAREQSAEYRTSVRDEIRLLLVHGILHLLGYDHEQPEEAEKMRAREEEILKLLGDKGT